MATLKLGTTIGGNTVYHTSNLTNLNQLTNGPGYTTNVGTVTSVGGTGSYGGLTLSGTVTGSGNLTLGGTPTGTWPIDITGNSNYATSAGIAGSAASAGSVSSSITFNTTGGAAAGTTFNGSSAKTIDYSTVGAAASSHTHSYLPLSGGTMTGTITRNIADDAYGPILLGTMGTNDSYRILAGGANNAGYLEIATADDGTEPIYIRQYTGYFGSIANSVTVLDSSGNSTFPGSVTAKDFSTVGNSTDTYYFSGSRVGVGTTFTIYDNGNTPYLNSYSGMSFRANFLGGANGSFNFSGGDVLVNSNVRAIQHQYANNSAYTVYNATTKSIDFIFN